jgi:hypothetical protein
LDLTSIIKLNKKEGTIQIILELFYVLIENNLNFLKNTFCLAMYFRGVAPNPDHFYINLFICLNGATVLAEVRSICLRPKIICSLDFSLVTFFLSRKRK